jgi:hypothetical protein
MHRPLDCAAGVGGGKARSRAAHRCRTDLAAKHTIVRPAGPCAERIGCSAVGIPSPGLCGSMW